MDHVAEPGAGRLRVLRICSVFETPVLDGRAAPFDPIGGMQHHTGQLSRVLDAHGVAQTVVTAYRPGAARLEPLGAHGQVLRLGVPVRHLRQLYSVPAARAVHRLAGEVDVVHAHLGEDLAVLPLARHAARRAGIPLVVTIHCSLRHTVAGAGLRAGLLQRFGGWIEGRTEATADAVITLTPTMARRLVDDGVPAERVVVIPSGADPSRFRPPLADPLPGVGRPRLLYVGRLAAQKGVETLIDAVPHLRSRLPLVVVGDGPLRAQLEGRARRLGVADRVDFTGFVAHRAVPAHLANADLLVLPSVYEELGSILVEALHAGLPVVASAVGGIPDIVDDGVTGRLVPPGDPVALAAAIDDVLGDAGTRRNMADAARRKAADYSWDRLGQRVLDVYRSVVEPAATRDRLAS